MPARGVTPLAADDWYTDSLVVLTPQTNMVGRKEPSKVPSEESPAVKFGVGGLTYGLAKLMVKSLVPAVDDGVLVNQITMVILWSPVELIIRAYSLATFVVMVGVPVLCRLFVRAGKPLIYT